MFNDGDPSAKPTKPNAIGSIHSSTIYLQDSNLKTKSKLAKKGSKIKLVRK